MRCGAVRNRAAPYVDAFTHDVLLCIAVVRAAPTYTHGAARVRREWTFMND